MEKRKPDTISETSSAKKFKTNENEFGKENIDINISSMFDDDESIDFSKWQRCKVLSKK